MFSAKRGSISFRMSLPSHSDHISPMVSSPTRVTTPPMSFITVSTARRLSSQSFFSKGSRRPMGKRSPSSS